MLFNRKYNELLKQYNEQEKKLKHLQQFYDNMMDLKEGDIHKSLQDVSFEARGIIVEYLKNLKITIAIKTNKVINNVQLIAYRNGVLSAIELFIQMLDTEKPKSEVSLLTRQKKPKKAGQKR